MASIRSLDLFTAVQIPLRHMLHPLLSSRNELVAISKDLRTASLVRAELDSLEIPHDSRVNCSTEESSSASHPFVAEEVEIRHRERRLLSRVESQLRQMIGSRHSL